VKFFDVFVVGSGLTDETGNWIFAAANRTEKFNKSRRIGQMLPSDFAIISCWARSFPQ
jgi:hypothetical protein